MDLDVNKLSKKDCLSLTLFGLISNWPSFDPPMTSKENFIPEKILWLSVMKFWKIYFSFPLKVTTGAVKIWNFLSKFFSNRFRIFEFCVFFSQVIFRTFVQHIFSVFRKIFSQSFAGFCLEIFSIFDLFNNEFRNFWKLGFIWWRETHPFWDFSYGKC